MLTTPEPHMPDADPETMSIEQIRQELAGYSPGTVAEVVELEEHMARRQARIIEKEGQHYE